MYSDHQVPIILIDFGKLKNLYTGLGQVSFQYAQELARFADEHRRFTYLVPNHFEGSFGNSVLYKIPSLKNRYFPYLNTGIDLWHALHQDSDFLPARGIPYLLTIHDLNFLEEKSAVNAKRRLARLQKKVNRASAIVYISRYTEMVALENLKIEVPGTVIYNGVEPETFEIKKQPAFLSAKKETKLYFTVGVIKEKKNFHVLIDFMLKLNNGVLIIAGDKSDNYAGQIQSRINQLNLQDRILMPGIISSEDRAWLYEHCDAFLFPSKIEGFGLPVIEAMSYGRPVFLSTCSSLPEVGGSDAYYWDNFDPDYMASVFHRSMKSSMDSDRVISRKKRAGFFNWNSSIRQYMEIYDKIIQSKL